MQLDDMSPDELEAVARRKRENATMMAAGPELQRALAKIIEDRFRGEYKEVYVLPAINPRTREMTQICVSGYGYDVGKIRFTGEARVYADGRVTEEHHRIKDIGPNGLGGTRTKKLWRPGKCVCQCAPRPLSS